MPDKKEKCFVIMPIGELDSYPANHFKHVYEDLISPAIEAAGFEAKRADDDKSSSLIQLNIISDIVSAPMAVCDLSTRNPNVLFELGIRQAFDLPVVLIEEFGTKRIFDIGSINTVDYRKELIYHEVLEDRDKIYKAICETKDNKKGINSIIKLLKIDEASLKTQDMSESDELKLTMNLIMNKLSSLEDTVLSTSKIRAEDSRVITWNDLRGNKQDDTANKVELYASEDGGNFLI